MWRKLPFLILGVWLLTFAALRSHAQFSDCNTAISVCAGIYQENNSPQGTGNVFEQSPGSCQTFGEFNSAWYVFTVQEDGVLNFILDPNNQSDDYDWSLYDITTGGCAGINTGASTEVSCNSYGSFNFIQGPTGISSANGGSGNSNGPGEFAGPPFNEDLQVSEGHVFALVVMNFSATLNGYTLDFSNSTASIFDNEAPQILDYEVNCEHTSVTFTLSESLPNTGFTTSNISVFSNGEPVALTAVNTSGSTYIHEFTITSNAMSSVSGPVTLQFNTPATDVCGNELPAQYDFQLNGAMTVSYTTTPACSGLNGGIALQINHPGNPCPQATLGSTVLTAGADCSVFTGDAINAGTYTLTVVNQETGCVVTQNNVVIPNENLTVSAGTDLVSCGLSAELSGSAATGTFQWLPVAGLTFSNPNDPVTTISASVPGDYLITALVVNGDCEATDQMNVTLSAPPQIAIAPQDPSCFYACDGIVEISDPANPDISVVMNGQTLSGSPVSFQNLCPGEYAAQVTFAPGCFSSYSFVIGEAPSFEAEFDYSPIGATIETPQVFAVCTTPGPDSVHWELINADVELLSEPAIDFELPRLPGTYELKMTVFKHGGCEQSITRTIILRDLLFIFVPNSFTPNNDGINDYFLPSISYAPQLYELKIFNRWGQPVFETTDHTKPWMGEVGSGEYYTQSDQYYWRLRIKGEEPEVIEKEGVVYLVR